MGAVDAHTHLDVPAFDADRDDVLRRAREAGVDGFVVAGAHPDDWDRVQATADALGAAWTLGVHPWHLVDLDDAEVARRMDELRARPTPHGVGETGLDHAKARDDDARARQLRVFREHLALARERDVPVVLHVVRAYGHALRVLEADGLPRAGGMVHAWSGHADLVRRALRLGLHLSFGSVFTRSERIAQAMAAVPDDRLLLETDCPDLPLDAGARGEPADLPRIAAVMAERRGTSAAHLLAVTAGNARRLFPALAR